MEKPNIVFILYDHQAYYGHGEMSGGPKIKRPNFEKLASEGVKFTRAYTACPLCGPARRTMLTGLFPHSHGEIKNDSNHPFDNEISLDRLAKAGYRNYYYGKWHSGPGTAHDHHCEGFSYKSYNNPYIKPEYEDYLKKKDLPHFQVKIQHSFQANLNEGELYSPNLTWYSENATGVMTTPKETHEAFFLANLASDKLREIAKDGNKQPFHLRVDFWGPHQPYFPAQEFIDQYDPKDIPEYPSFRDNLKDKPEIYQFDHHFRISEKNRIIIPNPLPWSKWQKILAFNYAQQTLMDEAGGMILDTLEKLGFAKNTLVIWVADHGDAVASHGGHFDKDAYMSEEVVRIPMAIKYPDKIPVNQVCNELVSNIDLAPTLLDVAGISFRNSVHGRSLMPLCSQKEVDWREDLMCQTYGHFNTHLGRLVVTDRYKYMWNEGDKDELYDLKKDPFEMKNLIDDYNHADILEDMKMKKWREKTDDKITRKMVWGRKLKLNKA
ncbi:MAG: sulfatase-like hydrolase/transferase [Promethearchaeota archaeon]